MDSFNISSYAARVANSQPTPAICRPDPLKKPGDIPYPNGLMDGDLILIHGEHKPWRTTSELVELVKGAAMTGPARPDETICESERPAIAAILDLGDHPTNDELKTAISFLGTFYDVSAMDAIVGLVKASHSEDVKQTALETLKNSDNTAAASAIRDIQQIPTTPF